MKFSMLRQPVVISNYRVRRSKPEERQLPLEYDEHLWLEHRCCHQNQPCLQPPYPHHSDDHDMPTMYTDFSHRLWLAVYIHCDPNIFDCNFKKSYQILIFSGVNIPDKTCHQMTVQLPTSPNVCFCTTKGMQTKRNMHWNMRKLEKTSPTLSIISWRNIIRF